MAAIMVMENPENKTKERVRFRDLPMIGAPFEEPEEDLPSPKPQTKKQSISYTDIVPLPEEPPPEKLRFTELRELPERVKPEVDFIPDEEEPKVLYEGFYKVTNSIYQGVADGSIFNFTPLLPVAEELVTSVMRPEEAVAEREEPLLPSFYREVISSIPEHLDWAAHAIHVATLSVKLGDGFGYSKEELAKLALAGLLHGVGMMTIPRSLLEEEGPLSSEQRSLIESHPIRGAELLSGAGPKLELLQTVLLQEHERHQGQGYPNKLSGKDIHEFARFIGLIDTFVSMTHPRPWRPARSPHEAAKEIVYIRKDEFDPRLLKLFINRVSIFPLGSLVKLTTNEIGQVVVVHEDEPLRPTVKILQDHNGEPLSKDQVLDLRRKNHLIAITGSASDEELAQPLK